MSMPAPTPHEAAYLAEFQADNRQDDERARELVAAINAWRIAGERMHELQRHTISSNAELMRHVLAQQVEATNQVRKIAKREAAIWILSGLAASTTAARARAATAERLAILDELAPE
jgi:hypothetical protein